MLPIVCVVVYNVLGLGCVGAAVQESTVIKFRGCSVLTDSQIVIFYIVATVVSLVVAKMMMKQK